MKTYQTPTLETIVLDVDAIRTSAQGDEIDPGKNDIFYSDEFTS